MKQQITLPNELLTIIGAYVYSQHHHSKFYALSRTTKSIMDCLAKKQGFEDYLSVSLARNNRCNDCRKKLFNFTDFFFEKKYKLCWGCSKERPKISPTEIKKNYLLKVEHLDTYQLPSISYKNEYKVWCKLYLKDDIEDLQRILYTKQDISEFYSKKQRRIYRLQELQELRDSRTSEIKEILSKFSNYTADCVIDNSSECDKYIQSNIPKNIKKKQEMINNLLSQAEYFERTWNYARRRGFLHEASKRRKIPTMTGTFTTNFSAFSS